MKTMKHRSMLAQAICVEDRLRERIREADGTSTGYARAGGTSAAMAGDLSGEPDSETIRSALEVEIRRAYAEGALEKVHRALKRAVRAWQLAIHAALIPARNTVEAKVRRHAAREAEVRRQASGETSEWAGRPCSCRAQGGVFGKVKGRCSPWPATVETDGNGPIGDPTGGLLRGTLGDLGALVAMPGCSER